MMRACAWVIAAALAPAAAAHAQDAIRFGVLGLFHPRELEVEPAGEQAVVIAGNGRFVLNGEPRHRRVTLRAEGDRVLARGVAAGEWDGAGRDGAAARFRLVVPGRFHRVFHGRLRITAKHGELIAVVEMEREEAVVSIVAAEMGSTAPLEALKAQAVVARSFLMAGARHRDFDFCDTTHCQYLRGADEAGARVREAVSATRGMVLEWHERTLAARYSSRCGGRTQSLRDAGKDPGDGYPYYAVTCAWCRQHPDAGPSAGHGMGLCQMGAMGMAAAGADFRAILAHYYPNTEVAGLR
jgi:peptidoglycan hydrolase-like amidase